MRNVVAGHFLCFDEKSSSPQEETHVTYNLKVKVIFNTLTQPLFIIISLMLDTFLFNVPFVNIDEDGQFLTFYCEISFIQSMEISHTFDRSVVSFF